MQWANEQAYYLKKSLNVSKPSEQSSDRGKTALSQQGKPWYRTLVTRPLRVHEQPLGYCYYCYNRKTSGTVSYKTVLKSLPHANKLMLHILLCSTIYYQNETAVDTLRAFAERFQSKLAIRMRAPHTACISPGGTIPTGVVGLGHAAFY